MLFFVDEMVILIVLCPSTITSMFQSPLANQSPSVVGRQCNSTKMLAWRTDISQNSQAPKQIDVRQIGPGQISPEKENYSNICKGNQYRFNVFLKPLVLRLSV